MKIKLDDGTSGVDTYMHFHSDGAGGDQFTIQNVQDCEPVLRKNARARQYYRENPQKGDIREVAEIPVTLIFKWLNEEGLDVFSSDPVMRNRLRKKLDSPEYAYLRTDESKLGQRIIT